MNYDERLEKLNEQAIELLKTQLGIEQTQSQALKRHEEMFTRIETNLAEATDKLNGLLGREMRREGGPETAAR